MEYFAYVEFNSPVDVLVSIIQACQVFICLGVGRIEYCYSGVAVSITSSIILGRE